MPKPTVYVQRQETPAMLLTAAIGGDGGARELVLAGALADVRILRLKPNGKIDKKATATAVQTYTSSGAALPVGHGSTPREFWAASQERCAIDGSVLIGGENLKLELDYGDVDAEERVRIRMLVAAGILGDGADAQADLVDTICTAGVIPEGSEGRVWRKARRYLDHVATPVDRANAEQFLADGPRTATVSSVQPSSRSTGPDRETVMLFASIFTTEASAGEVLHDAGFPEVRRPIAMNTPFEFWQAVMADVEDLVPGGLATLYAAALRARPYNDGFKALTGVSVNVSPVVSVTATGGGVAVAGDVHGSVIVPRRSPSYEIWNEKLQALESARALETRADEKLRLDHLIQEARSKLYERS